MADDPVRYSFVIPTFNRAGLVMLSIRSALAWLAAGQDGEVVVVDDASQDRTVAQLQTEFAPEIASGIMRLVVLPYNVGVIPAKNIGGQTARGRWLIFLDSDDLLRSSEAATMRAALREFESAPVVFFRCEDLRTGKLIGAPQSEPTELSLLAYLNSDAYGECLPVVRKDIFDRFPYDETLDGWEGLTYARIMRAEGSIIIVPVIARRYRSEGADRLTSPSGLRRRARSMAYGHWLLLRQFSPYMTPLARLHITGKVAYYSLQSFLRG